MKYRPLLLSALLLASSPAFSQAADPAVLEKMDRLERDIMLMQRQMARGEPMPATTPLSDEQITTAGGPAQLEVRLSAMEEEMRKLRGKIEEVEFQTRKTGETLDKFQKDTEFRFNELSANPQAPSGAPADPAAASAERKPIAGNGLQAPAGEEPAAAAPAAAAQAGGEAENFATPRDHYNHAFRLLNQTKYEEASKAFDSFTKQYPKDPLIGNAYYWQGETHYIRRDYVTAADSFRQGFEALPGGPKAADNLLKLAMSLNALKRDKEACVVLGQIITKFKKTSVSVVDKASQEQKRIGCQ